LERSLLTETMALLGAPFADAPLPLFRVVSSRDRVRFAIVGKTVSRKMTALYWTLVQYGRAPARLLPTAYNLGKMVCGGRWKVPR
jgi:hypothetical protein